MECVQCSGTKKVKSLADTSSIKVDCQGNAPSSNLCKAACGSDAACDEKSVGECTGANTLKKCSSSCAPISSCGDGQTNCGEACDASNPSDPNKPKCTPKCTISPCGACSIPNTLGTLSNYGDTLSAATCAISSTAQDDIFKFNVNKAGYVVATLTSSAGIGIDGIQGPTSSNYCSGTFRCNTDGSTSPGTPMVSCSFYTSSLGDYGYDATWWSGSGTATVTAKLVECVANNAIDSACPSAKPYCSNNQCVECVANNAWDSKCPSTKPYCTGNTCVQCLSDANCGFTAGNIKRLCDCPLAGCSWHQFEDYRCTDPTTCDNNEQCKDKFCCESEINKDVNSNGKIGDCVGTSSIGQPYLCT